ncbi:hypothetical protein SRB5_10530 [Streptomyces sp. RB5]|uniref:Uncharacterized protein n=1 Tax=Streptomyces smaragdinus TaxID=2585196 RepID=A0A7K0CBX2_9ACTN|nr:hypothetical protein [Streptomyces smaragdinus]
MTLPTTGTRPAEDAAPLAGTEHAPHGDGIPQDPATLISWWTRTAVTSGYGPTIWAFV